MQTMQREKSGLSATSYAETSFTGAQTLSEQAWVATKDIYPDMSSSELEVSYSSKAKLQVKMFGAGKKTYDLFTKNRRTGRDQINPNLSKEIKDALGPSKYEKVRQTIYEKRKELKEKQYEASQKEKNKKEMDEIREAIKKKQQQIEAFENKEGSQDEIDKLKRELTSLETQHQNTRSAYMGIVQAAEDRSILEEDIQVLDDSQAVDVAEKEKEEAGEALKSIKKRKEALEQRRRFELGKFLDNEVTDFTPERKQEAEKKIEAIDQETKRLNEEEKEFQTILGARNEYAEKEMKLLQIDKEELEKAQKKDLEIMNDKDAAPYEKDAAEERVDWCDKEIRRVEARLEEIGREADAEKSLWERVKDIFKKYGVTLTAIFVAAGTTIGAVIGVLTRGLKATGNALGNGLKELGKKLASIFPGLIGSIVSFLFKAASQVVWFLAEHTWLLILAAVAFLFDKYFKKQR